MEKEKIIEKGYDYERMLNIIKNLSYEDTNKLVDFLLQFKESDSPDELYPKEFVEWIGLEYGFHDLSLREMDMKWIYPLEPIAFSDYFTTNELYNYWLTIKDK
jgi:hypothetical protein